VCTVKLDFFINSKLDLKDNIEQIKFTLDQYQGFFSDAEDKNQKLYSFSSLFKADDEFELIDLLVAKLQDIYNTADIYCSNSEQTDPKAFSRIMITLEDIELEDRKINFTEDPHKAHIHIFNRNGNGMIRIKELQYKDLLYRSISILKTIKEEI